MKFPQNVLNAMKRRRLKPIDFASDSLAGFSTRRQWFAGAAGAAIGGSALVAENALRPTSALAQSSSFVDTTSNQTVGGIKTFTQAPVLPEGTFALTQVIGTAMVAASVTGPFAPSTPGATAATRYVGGTAGGAPTTGTFAVGDFVIDQTAKVWICTAAGTPGTWAQQSGSGVDLTTDQSVGGVKTFTAAPVVPVDAFSQAAVAGLVADLAAKQATIPSGTYASTPASVVATAVVTGGAAQTIAKPIAINGTHGADTLTLDTGGGSIQFLSSVAEGGARIRLNDDTSRQGAQVFGIDWARDGARKWDLDMDGTASGDLVFDDVSGPGSCFALALEPGQTTLPGVRIGGIEVQVGRQLLLTDPGNGIKGIIQLYTVASGLRWLDHTQQSGGTSPLILQTTLGAAGKFVFKPGGGTPSVTLDASGRIQLGGATVDVAAVNAVGANANDPLSSILVGNVAGFKKWRLIAGQPGADNTRLTVYDQTATAARAYFDTNGLFVPLAGIRAFGGVTIGGTSVADMTLELKNLNAGGRRWRLSPIAEGVAHDWFTLRDVTAGLDRLRIDAVGRLYLMAHDLEFGTVSKGPVVRSPNGTRYRLVVDNAGVLTATVA